MKFRRLTAVIAASAIALSMSACRDDYTREGGLITTADPEVMKEHIETTVIKGELTLEETVQHTVEASSKLVVDRENTLIGAPARVEKIVSCSPEITQMLIELGLGSKIVAADVDSAGVAGVSPTICTLHRKIITVSAMAEIAPDAIIIDGTSADTVYTNLKSAEFNVACIPAASSIEDVKLNIDFLASYLSVEEKGAEVTGEIDRVVNDIRVKAETIDVKRKAYFEEQSVPELRAYGSGTLAWDIAELVGAIAVFPEQVGVASVTSDDVIRANPDIILTSVAYDGYDINEIKTRTGWNKINAVKNGAIYQVSEISQTASVTDSIYEIAKAIYPELYTDDAASVA
ncbi:MAG: ABC transporter substrate-binding protein [Oscillospiraceae bacterium]|nr:ABC transporter substrate-binding protein [Oscillospiraceae bacterium]